MAGVAAQSVSDLGPSIGVGDVDRRQKKGGRPLWIRGDIGGNLNGPQLCGDELVPVVLNLRCGDPPKWFPLCSNIGVGIGSRFRALGSPQRISGGSVLPQVFGPPVGSGPHEATKPSHGVMIVKRRAALHAGRSAGASDHAAPATVDPLQGLKDGDQDSAGPLPGGTRGQLAGPISTLAEPKQRRSSPERGGTSCEGDSENKARARWNALSLK